MGRISLTALRTRRDRRTGPRRTRWTGAVEGLEGRSLLSTFTWNGQDGSFNEPTKWTGPNENHSVPGPGDDAVAPPGSYTISVTGSATVNSFAGSSALSVTAGTFSVTGATRATPSTVSNLAVAAGASFHSSLDAIIQGTGTINGNLDASAGGTIVLAGSTDAIHLGAGVSLTGGGTFQIASGVNVDAALTAPVNLVLDSGDGPGLGGAGTLTVPSGATLDWRSGTMSGAGGSTTILAGATLKMDGDANKSLLDRALNNAGTASLANNGGLTIGQNSVFTNAGTFTIQNEQPITGSGTLENTGTLSKSSSLSNGKTILSVRLRNAGTLVVTGGVLLLDNGGSSTGIFSSPSPAGLLAFAGKGYTLDPGTTFTGPGTVHFAAGALGSSSINLNTAVTIPNLAIDDGVVSGPGTLTVPGTLSIDKGTLSIAVLSIPAGASLNLAGSNTATFDRGLFNDAGTTTISGSESFQLTNGATFQNAGSFAIQDDRAISGQGTFINYGTLTKTSPSGTGTTSISATFNNAGGTVVLRSGVLRLDNGGTNSGAFSSPAGGGTLAITGKGYALNPGSAFLGPGGVHFTGGSLGTAGVVLNGNVTIPNLDIDDGSVTGPGSLTVPGTLLVNSGTLSIGTLNLPAGANLGLTGSRVATFDAGVFNNAGLATLAGLEGFRLTNGAIFNNSGTFLILSDTTGSGGNLALGGNTSFVNAPTGIVTKISNAGTGTTNFSGGTFTNRGVVHVISGQLLLEDAGSNAGTFSVDPNATLALAGTWAVNAGSYLAGSGIYTVGAGSLGFGTINVNADVSLANFGLSGGTLNVSPSTTLTAATLNWIGGQIAGAGTVAIPAGGVLNIGGPATKSMIQAALSNSGYASWSGAGDISLNGGAAIFNQAGANFNATGDAAILGGSGGIFNNFGTLAKTSPDGAGTTSLDVSLNDFQGGSISVISGNLATSSLVNFGKINLGLRASLRVSGDYDQPFAGTLNVAIGGAPETNLFGQLRVTGRANLNGTLTVVLANNFVPALGQSTPILTFGTSVGKFIAFNLPTAGNLPIYTPSTKATEYDLIAARPGSPTGLALAPASQSGGANATRMAAPTFTGRAQALAGVQIYVVTNGVYNLVAVGDSAADGTFTARTIKPFTPGAYTLVAVAYNALGSGTNGLPYAFTVLA